ncbi:phosphodiesterase [Vallicoccus soli]|uniref:Phosphodiesterase n=1 Tax=Vallicoccus soli TaxID=2339232 RepID=A0A3A3Z4N3_9ACTN|nr:phosphodiesterase [Vallicoccus soli]
MTAAASAGLGAAFRGVAALRAAKPLHPYGVLLRATVRRTAGGRWGAPWLDEAGEDRGAVRVSRSAGLPHPLPDVLGLALRVPGPDGPADLLLASCLAAGVPGRFVFAPRLDVAARCSSVMTYRTATGREVVLGVAPPAGGRRVPMDLATLPERLAADPLLLDLVVATPAGPWQPYGTLEVAGAAADEPDPALAYEPVRHPLPGLRMAGPLARVRSDAYTQARRGRGADEADLDREVPVRP